MIQLELFRGGKYKGFWGISASMGLQMVHMWYVLLRRSTYMFKNNQETFQNTGEKNLRYKITVRVT